MRTLTDHLGWKLFSLALAVGLWWMLSDETEMATSLPAAIRYRNVPHDLEFSADNIERLFLKVRGPASRLTTAGFNQVALVINLDEVDKPGERTFTINESNLELPVGVNLIEVVPSQVRVRVEQRSAKNVPVEVRFAGPPPRGYRVVSQSVAPTELRVVGPQSRLDQVQSLQTDPIDLSSQIGITTARVPVYLPDLQFHFANGDPVVTVRVVLEKIPQGQL